MTTWHWHTYCRRRKCKERRFPERAYPVFSPISTQPWHCSWIREVSWTHIQGSDYCWFEWIYSYCRSTEAMIDVHSSLNMLSTKSWCFGIPPLICSWLLNCTISNRCRVRITSIFALCVQSVALYVSAIYPPATAVCHGEERKKEEEAYRSHFTEDSCEQSDTFLF